MTWHRRLLTRRSASLTKLTEILYAPSATDREWAARLVNVAKATLDRSADVAFLFIEQREGVGIAAVMERATNRPEPLDGPTPADGVEHGDSVQIVGRPDVDAVAVLYIYFDAGVTLSTYERKLFARFGLHLENALRFRRRPDTTFAVLSLDGELDASAHATGNKPGSRTASLSLWNALTSGRASLVASGRRSTRRYHALEAPPSWASHRSLTEQEVRIVTMAASGMDDRTLARSLDLAPATISTALRAAAAKIGLPSPFELVRLAARLALDEPQAPLPETLTAAERDVLTLLRAGLSNEEIARRRGRATRTIANQVASLLRKTNSTSRRALAGRSRPRETRSSQPPKEHEARTNAHEHTLD